MARHDHFCHDCQREFEVNTAEPSVCTRCGSMNTHWVPKLGNTGGFATFYHPNLGHHPVEITSARQLDKELATRNLHIAESPKREKYQRLPQTVAEARHLR